MAEYRYYLIPDAMTRAFPEQFEKQTPTEFFDNIADLKKRYPDPHLWPQQCRTGRARAANLQYCAAADVPVQRYPI